MNILFPLELKSLSLRACLVIPCLLGITGAVQKPALTTSNDLLSNPQEKIIEESHLISMNSGTTYYVSGNGNDSNNGLSKSSAFRTIQKAADQTRPGDTVLIMNGEYRNSNIGQVVHITRSGNANAWITYKAYPGDLPKIKHNAWNGIKIERGASHIEINGLEVEGNNANISLNRAQNQRYNTSDPQTNGNCISVDGRNNGHPRHIRILNNKVHNCGGGGISIIQSDYVTVDGNEVFNNAWYSVYANSGISMWQNWNSDGKNQDYKMIVTNNKVYNNRQYVKWIANGKITDGNGIIIDDSRNTQNGSRLGTYNGRTLVANNVTFNNGGSGIHTFKSENVDIIHNTAVRNGKAPELDDGQIFANESSNVRILNNILYDDSRENKRINMNSRNRDVRYDYNVYYTSGNVEARGPNDIVANPSDPPFLNLGNNDFRLKANSLPIDKATPTSWSNITTDFLGNPRPSSGNRYDIGAFQYQN